MHVQCKQLHSNGLERYIGNHLTNHSTKKENVKLKINSIYIFSKNLFGYCYNYKCSTNNHLRVFVCLYVRMFCGMCYLE